MRLALLVGPSGQGKSTICSKAVELAKNSGLQVSGILSLPMYQNQVKVAIALRDITTGQERILARAHQEGDGPLIGSWRFDRQTMAWGQQVLASLPASDLLVLTLPLARQALKGMINAQKTSP